MVLKVVTLLGFFLACASSVPVSLPNILTANLPIISSTSYNPCSVPVPVTSFVPVGPLPLPCDAPLVVNRCCNAKSCSCNANPCPLGANICVCNASPCGCNANPCNNNCGCVNSCGCSTPSECTCGCVETSYVDLTYGTPDPVMAYGCGFPVIDVPTIVPACNCVKAPSCACGNGCACTANTCGCSTPVCGYAVNPCSCQAPVCVNSCSCQAPVCVKSCSCQTPVCVNSCSCPTPVCVNACGCPTLPPLPPVVGCCGQYLRQIVVQPPFL